NRQQARLAPAPRPPIVVDEALLEARSPERRLTEMSTHVDRRLARGVHSCLLVVAGAVLAAALLTACGSSANGNSSSGATMKRVGLMHVGTDHVPPSLVTLARQLETQYGWDVKDLAVKRCADALRKRCDFKGKNLELIWRNLEPGEADAQARKFVDQHVDVIVAFEDTSIDAAQRATAKDRIPIVFLHP